MLYSRSLLFIYFTYSIDSVYRSIPISQFIPPPFVLYICLYFCFVNKIVYSNFFRFHIYVLIYDVGFSLSELLHSVWQCQGPSTSLQMTQFRSFLWLSNPAETLIKALASVFPFLLLSASRPPWGFPHMMLCGNPSFLFLGSMSIINFFLSLSESSLVAIANYHIKEHRTGPISRLSIPGVPNPWAVDRYRSTAC